MPMFERYELQNNDTIILYLNRNETEFAKEPGRNDKQDQLNTSVRDYVRSKFPDLKLKTAKVMLGTVLVASVPIGGAAYATGTDTPPSGTDTTVTQQGTTTGETTTGTTTGTVPASITLSDIENSYAKADIQNLVDRGIVTGFPDGTFKPTESMSRQNFAIVLANSLGLDLEEYADAEIPFTDVSEYARPAVAALIAEGYAKGYDADTYGAKDAVSREQMVTFFMRAMHLDDDAEKINMTGTFDDLTQASGYAQANIALAQSLGFAKGINAATFAPQQNASREEAAVWANRFVTNKDQYVEAGAKAIAESESAITSTAAITADNQAAFTVTGTGIAGMAVTLLLTDADNKTATATGTVGADNTFSIPVDAKELKKGNITLKATFTSNDATMAEKTQTVTKESDAVAAPVADTTAPTLTVTGTATAAVVTASETLYYKGANDALVAVADGVASPDLFTYTQATDSTGAVTNVTVDNTGAHTWTFEVTGATEGDKISFGDTELFDVAGNSLGATVSATFTDGAWVLDEPATAATTPATVAPDTTTPPATTPDTTTPPAIAPDTTTP